MEHFDSIRSNQPYPALCESELERKTEDDESVVVDDLMASSDTDSSITTSVYETEGSYIAHS